MLNKHRIDQEEVYQQKRFESLIELNKLNLKTLKYFNEKRVQKKQTFYASTQNIYAILKYQLTKQKLNYSVLNV